MEKQTHHEKNVKYRRGICFCILSYIILFFHPGNAPADISNSMRLQNKMVEISSLCSRLMERKAQAVGLCEQLKRHMETLEIEIENEKKRSQIVSYQTAISNLRVDYDIRLIQKIRAYLTGLREKIQYLEIGSEELEFLYQQAEDDLKICKTLNDMKIERLMAQVDKVFHNYESEADKLVLREDEIVLVPAEQIWNEFMERE